MAPKPLRRNDRAETIAPKRSHRNDRAETRTTSKFFARINSGGHICESNTRVPEIAWWVASRNRTKQTQPYQKPTRTVGGKILIFSAHKSNAKNKIGPNIFLSQNFRTAQIFVFANFARFRPTHGQTDVTISSGVKCCFRYTYSDVCITKIPSHSVPYCTLPT